MYVVNRLDEVVVSEDDGQKSNGFVTEGAHAVRLCGIEVDAVAFVQGEHFLTDGQLHSTFEHHVKLLTAVGIHLLGGIGCLGFHSDDEGISLPATEATGQTLIVIGLTTLHMQSLSLTGEEDISTSREMP